MGFTRWCKCASSAATLDHHHRGIDLAHRIWWYAAPERLVTATQEESGMSHEISRRRFLSTVAVTVAAAQIGVSIG